MFFVTIWVWITGVRIITDCIVSSNIDSNWFFSCCFTRFLCVSYGIRCVWLESIGKRTKSLRYWNLCWFLWNLRKQLFVDNLLFDIIVVSARYLLTMHSIQSLSFIEVLSFKCVDLIETILVSWIWIVSLLHVTTIIILLCVKRWSVHDIEALWFGTRIARGGLNKVCLRLDLLIEVFSFRYRWRIIQTRRGLQARWGIQIRCGLIIRNWRGLEIRILFKLDLLISVHYFTLIL